MWSFFQAHHLCEFNLTPSTVDGENALVELFAIEQEEEEMLCPVDGGVSAGTHLHTATQKKTSKRFYLLFLSCKNFGGLFYFKH